MELLRPSKKARVHSAEVYWSVFDTLLVYKILQALVSTSTPDYIQNVVQLVCKQWQNVLCNQWFFWKPIFDKLANERQKLLSPGLVYQIRPQVFSHLNCLQLWKTKFPVSIDSTDIFSGVGCRFFKHGGFYEGQIAGNRFHGLGVLYQTAGDRSPAFRYNGQFKWNDFSGTGCEYAMANGDIFTGECRKSANGQYLCNGKWDYHTGDRYIGEILENSRHGEGTYYSASDGSTYHGGWYHNQRHGRGLITLADGTTKNCYYQNGIERDARAFRFGNQ